MRFYWALLHGTFDNGRARVSHKEMPQPKCQNTCKQHRFVYNRYSQCQESFKWTCEPFRLKPSVVISSRCSGVKIPAISTSQMQYIQTSSNMQIQFRANNTPTFQEVPFPKVFIKVSVRFLEMVGSRSITRY